MIPIISRKLLVAALTISTIACSQLDAMKRKREEPYKEIALASDFGAELPSEINQYILILCDSFPTPDGHQGMLNLDGSAGILDLIQHARKTFRLGTQATIEVLRLCLTSKCQANQTLLQFLITTRDNTGYTVLHHAMTTNDLDSLRIICILAGNDLQDLAVVGCNGGLTAFDRSASIFVCRYNGIARISCCNNAQEIKTLLFALGNHVYDFMARTGNLIDAVEISYKSPKNELIDCTNYITAVLEVIFKAVNDKAYNLMIIRSTGIRNTNFPRKCGVNGTALHGVSLVDVAKFLLTKFQDKFLTLLFIANDKGETPLHLAVKRGNTGVVKVYLEAAGNTARALIWMPTNDCKTAIDYADEFGFVDIKNLLEQYLAGPVVENEQIEPVYQNNLIETVEDEIVINQNDSSDTESEDSEEQTTCVIQ